MARKSDAEWCLMARKSDVDWRFNGKEARL